MFATTTTLTTTTSSTSTSTSVVPPVDIRLNHVQMLGSHNSFHLVPEPTLFAGIEAVLPLPRPLRRLHIVVGLVTVAAIVGQGGLGGLIFSGLRRAFWTPMTVGATLSIIVALVLDGLIYLIGAALTPWTRRTGS